MYSFLILCILVSPVKILASRPASWFLFCFVFSATISKPQVIAGITTINIFSLLLPSFCHKSPLTFVSIHSTLHAHSSSPSCALLIWYITRFKWDGGYFIYIWGKSIVTGGGKSWIGASLLFREGTRQSHMISHLIQSHQIKKAFTFVFPWSFSIMEIQYSSPQVSSADYFFSIALQQMLQRLNNAVLILSLKDELNDKSCSNRYKRRSACVNKDGSLQPDSEV